MSFYLSLRRAIAAEMASGAPLQRLSRAATAAQAAVIQDGPGWAPRLIEDYLDCLRAGSECFDSSYRHNNGFDKLSLFKDPDSGLHIRLHIWEGRATTTVHDHAWDFVSIVLAGSLTLENFSAELSLDKGEELTCYRLDEDRDPSGTLTGKRQTLVGPVRLQVQSGAVVPKGAVHFLAHDVLHRAHTGSPGLNVSFVVTSMPRRTFSHVCRTAALDAPTMGQYHVYEREGVVARLTKLVSQLRGGD